MYLQANPSKAKTQEEKDDIAKSYKLGDRIIPELRSRRANDSGDEEDRRLLEEVREMSLRDSGRSRRGHSHSHSHSQSQSQSQSRSSGHRRDRSAELREADERHRRRRREEERRRRRERDVSDSSRSQTRQVEHQSSLRSLLSSSDGQSTMEEEILRQILDEGLLDGVDLHDLDVAQEDEISERIAEAYRRRHQQQPASPQPPPRRSSDQVASSDRSRATRHTRSHSVQSDNEGPRAHPPVSRPHLFEASLQPPTGRRRAGSDQSRRRATSNPRNIRTSSDDVARQATRSATDLSTRPQTRATRAQAGVPEPSRRTTDPEASRDEVTRRREARTRREETTLTSSPISTTMPTGAARSRGPSSQPRSRSASASRPSSSSSARPRATLYAEPSINCDQCGKQNIQYDVHQHCSKCNEGKYNVCLRCFRRGKGCLKYSGWGDAHQIQHLPSTEAASADEHTLVGQRYLRPPQEATQAATTPTTSVRLTTSDPSRRLQEGLFCDMCSEYADACFWNCAQCNLGDWGFCNQCVNQGKCCNHPLLPVAKQDLVTSPTSDTNAAPAVTLPASATLASDAAINPLAQPTTSTQLTSPSPSPSPSPYRALSFSAACDICTYPIPPSSTRFHCPHCNNGDYDVCTNCYLRLVTTGKISKDNGHFGWRRCQHGHRMIVVGFEDTEFGQKRVVVRDLVGGTALKDEGAVQSVPSSTATAVYTPSSSVTGPGHWSWKEPGTSTGNATRMRTLPSSSSTSGGSNSALIGSGGPTSRFPPDGGVGICGIARWGWFPEDGAKDELMFPRGAEVREAEDINGDWFWGCYAGQKGLFPGGYVKVLGVVGL